MMLKSFLIVAFICYVNSANLPPFLQACAKHDNKCALEVANKAIPHLLDGYKPFKIRSLNPFKFDKVDLSSGANLQLFLTNGEVTNLKSIHLTDISVDAENKKLSINGTLNPVVDADYDVNGQILVLPIKGTGKAQFDLSNCVVEYVANLKVVKKNGEDYLKLVNDDTKMTVGLLKMKLENLFNGDKALGDQVNSFINENWETVEKEFHNGIVAIISTVLQGVINPILENVPISKILL